MIGQTMPILRQRLRAVYFFLICGLFSLLLMLIIMSGKQYATNQDSINRIDHTGRLRMLGQRTVQRIILATVSPDTNSHEIRRARVRFEATLSGLKQGSKELRLRPASTDKTLAQIEVIERRWDDIIHIETARIVYGGNSVDVARLSMLGDQLLEECERLMIAERQRLAEGHTDTARIVGGSLFCVLLLGVVSLRLVGRERRLYAAEEAARTSRELLTSVQKNESRLKAILASAIDPLFTMDHDLKIENASDSVEAAFGWQKDEVVGKNIRELIPQVELPADANMQRDSVQDFTQLLGRPLERTAVRRDGSEFPCLLTVWAVDAPDDGEHPLFIGILRDITEQKRAEAEVYRNAKFLQNIINTVPDLLAVKSADLRLVIANEAYCEAMGVPKEHLLGKHEGEIETRVTMDDISHIAQRVLATGKTEVVEQLATLADGTQHLYSVKKSRYEDPVTAEQYLVSTSRDITEIRERQQKLILLANVFNNSTEGAAILDSQGTIIEANPTFAKIAEKKTEDLKGHNLEAVLEWDLDSFSDTLGKVVHGERWVGTTRVFNQLKEESAYLVSFSSMQCEPDGVVNIIALFSDVSEIHRAHKRLRKQALLDNVTNLPNRRFFRQQIEQMIEDAPLDGTRFAVCFIDLDDFKHVNDSLGHQAGDELLRKVAHRIEEHVPPGRSLPGLEAMNSPS